MYNYKFIKCTDSQNAPNAHSAFLLCCWDDDSLAPLHQATQSEKHVLQLLGLGKKLSYSMHAFVLMHCATINMKCSITTCMFICTLKPQLSW
jgi:hypothetical protein